MVLSLYNSESLGDILLNKKIQIINLYFRILSPILSALFGISVKISEKHWLSGKKNVPDATMTIYSLMLKNYREYDTFFI